MDITFVDNPWFWAWAIPAVILTGISKSGLGSGVGGYTVPMMAMAISPVQAAAIALPILCVIDLAALRAWWGKWDRRIMRVIVPGGLIGIALGGITFRYMSDNWIKVMIGCIALGYLGFNGLKLLGKAGAVRKPMGDNAGRFWSTVSAFTSTIAHAGGPPMAVYLLSQKLEHTGKLAVLLSMDNVKMRRPVVPGDQLVLVAETIRVKSRTGHVRCQALVGDKLAAEAEIKFMLVDAEPV